MPDFVVIGALRAGTTTLYSLLSQAPGICLSLIKETDFFIAQLNYDRGPDWYASLFPHPELVCGDISPNYSTSDRFPGVAERLKAQAPHAKVIYLVRDPVDRARSHYQHTWLKGDPIPGPEDFIETPLGAHILGASRYYEQVMPYIEAFGQERVLILDFDDVRADPQGVVAQVAAFVGVDLEADSLSALDTQPRNATSEVATVPSWWIRATRSMETAMPSTTNMLRQSVPQPLKSSMRQALGRVAVGDRQAPTLEPAVTERIAVLLAEDAARFRELTGMAFEKWRL